MRTVLPVANPNIMRGRREGRWAGEGRAANVADTHTHTHMYRYIHICVCLCESFCVGCVCTFVRTHAGLYTNIYTFTDTYSYACIMRLHIEHKQIYIHINGSVYVLI